MGGVPAQGRGGSGWDLRSLQPQPLWDSVIWKRSCGGTRDSRGGRRCSQPWKREQRWEGILWDTSETRPAARASRATVTPGLSIPDSLPCWEPGPLLPPSSATEEQQSCQNLNRGISGELEGKTTPQTAFVESINPRADKLPRKEPRTDTASQSAGAADDNDCTGCCYRSTTSLFFSFMTLHSQECIHQEKNSCLTLVSLVGSQVAVPRWPCLWLGS